ncbi:glutathione S-transferase family protein [Labrys okinawensis]|uniref:glutathione S-transferase family protein n=1 Tax=Labrys okinawensis TaxID=346911 RepID=UPI0015E37AC4|nr:glutathione S-transferase family protein [Labrys okinawensis]
MRITLFGTPDSVYTRIIRLILEFKNVGHDFVMADIFDDGGLPDDYERRHPFRRIPCIEIDGMVVYETDAIAHYLEALLPEPSLIPADARTAMRMRQIMRVVDNYAYRPLVWGIYVPQWGRDGTMPAQETLTEAETALRALQELVGEGGVGLSPNLAWCYLAPVLAVADSVAAGSELIDRVPALKEWWHCVRSASAMVRTRSSESRY